MSKNKNPVEGSTDIAPVAETKRVVTNPKKISVYTFLVAEPPESGIAALLKCRPYQTMVQTVEDWRKTVEELRNRKVAH